MWNRKKAKSKRRKARRHRWRTQYQMTIFGVLAGAAALLVIGIWIVSRYEDSVLEIYAEQQDAYVQLVLDQINIQPNRTDEEIVQNILGSLDASNQKYWTLDKEKTLLFVKNVLETNRYKGYQETTFYESDTASKFMKGLKKNHVTHEIIEVDGNKYVASGVVFTYKKTDYGICLLTDETMIMDNNAFLSSKIGTAIYYLLLVVVLLLVTMMLLKVLDTRDQEIKRLTKRTESQNIEIQQLESQVKYMDCYHTRWSLFEGKIMDTFVRKIERRGVRPVSFIRIDLHGPKRKESFLEQSQLLLDEQVIRFSVDEYKIVLVFMKYRMEEAQQAMKILDQRLFTVGKTLECLSGENLWDSYQRFLEE